MMNKMGKGMGTQKAAAKAQPKMGGQMAKTRAGATGRLGFAKGGMAKKKGKC